MGTTVGRVDFIAGLDGKNLPPEARALGRKIGRAMGDELGNELEKTVDKDITRLGDKWGRKMAADMRRGLIPVQRSFRELRESIIVNTPALDALQRRADIMRVYFRDAARDGVDRFRFSIDSLGERARAIGSTLREHIDVPLGRLRESFDAAHTRVTNFTERALTPLRQRLNQVRASTERARERMDAFSDSVRTRVHTALDRVATPLRNFRDHIRALGPDLDAIRPSFRGFQTELDRFNRTAFRPRVFRDLGRALRGTALASDDASVSTRRLMTRMRGLGGESDRTSRLLRTHVAKTIAAWTLLVLAIGEGTASLGSGLGAALTGIISSVGVGLVGALGMAGAAVGGFVAQLGLAINSIRFLYEEVPAVKDAVGGLTSVLDDMGRRFAAEWGPSVANFLETLTRTLGNTAIVDAMAASLSRITDSFSQMLESPGFQLFYTALSTTIPNALALIGEGVASFASGLASVFSAASPALEKFAGMFADWAGSWSEAMNQAATDGSLQQFFDLALESLTSILDLVSSLSGALMTLFEAGAPSGNRMLDTLTGLLDRWNEWMQSVEGQRVLEEWFSNGERIFDALLDLLGDLGSALGDLVTPESIDRLVNFMDRLGDFLPVASDILELIGRLDILNILTAALIAIGDLLEPLMPVLQEFAESLGIILVESIEELAPKLGELGVALAPFLELVGELILSALPPLVDLLVDLIEYATVFAEALFGTSQSTEDWKKAVEIAGEVVRITFEVVGGVIGTVLDVTGGLLKWVAELLRGDFSGAFETMQETVRSVFERFGWDFDGAIQWVEDLWTNVSKFFGKIGTELGNFGDDVARIFGGVIGWIQDAIGWFGSLFGAASSASGAAQSAARGGGGSMPRAAARGMLLYGPRNVIAGEAGPEAIVPLNRPLSQVDPSVRWLSAFAQGKSQNVTNNSSTTDRSIMVMPGAFQVVASGDTRQTGYDVFEIFAERVAS